MAENNKWRHQKALDRIDFNLLALVGEGANSLTVISGIMNIPVQTLHNRVQILIALGYMASLENRQKHQSRKYQLTKEGEMVIVETKVFLNLIHLRLQSSVVLRER